MDRPWLKFYEPGIPHHLQYPDVPLDRLLDRAVKDFPEKDAIVFHGRKITYRELGEGVANAASGLAQKGLRKGQRMAIMLPNCPQYVVVYYAILKIGGIVVNVNPMYVERELEFQLKDAGVEIILALRDYYPRLQAVKAAVSLKTIILTDLDEKDVDKGLSKSGLDTAKEVWDYSELLETGKRLPPPSVKVNPEEVAVLQYTGGTTGFSKGAMLTHRNLIADVFQCVSWNQDAVRGEERMLAVLPFFHAYGMTVAMNEAIELGAMMIILPRFNADDALEAINLYRPTRFPGVPTMYMAIMNHPQIQKYNVSSIRVCSAGSAPMPVEAQKRFEELTGAKISEGYGLTEAAPVTHANPFLGKRKIGSIGLPRPDVDSKIVDLEAGEKDLPPGEMGELCIRGPQVMQGYWNRPDETKKTLRNGWLYTGDIAYMDEEGYFFVVDRKKDMIICSGYNVYPREIEEVLYQHPKIREACALGVPDAYRGETVKVFLVLKEKQQATAEEIIEYCQKNMAKYKVPTAVEFRQELPKSNIGKVLRKVLREEEMKKSSNHPNS